MQIVKPRNNTVIDVYKAWCLKRIKEDPELTLIYDYNFKRSGVKILYRGRISRQGQRTREEGRIIMTYALFRRILETYNKMAADMIVEGTIFNLGSRLGNIRARRLGRNFNKLQPNFEETRKLRQTEPDHPIVYYTDEDYCKICWKKSCQITNETFYSFDSSNSGLKRKFINANKANPVLKYNYPFTPYCPPVAKTA